MISFPAAYICTSLHLINAKCIVKREIFWFISFPPPTPPQCSDRSLCGGPRLLVLQHEGAVNTDDQTREGRGQKGEEFLCQTVGESEGAYTLSVVHEVSISLPPRSAFNRRMRLSTSGIRNLCLSSPFEVLMPCTRAYRSILFREKCVSTRYAHIRRIPVLFWATMLSLDNIVTPWVCRRGRGSGARSVDMCGRMRLTCACWVADGVPRSKDLHPTHTVRSHPPGTEPPRALAVTHQSLDPQNRKSKSESLFKI